jgi:hypothetical protein
MAEAKTNAGSKLSICLIPQNEDLNQSEFAALTYMRVKKVSSNRRARRQHQCGPVRHFEHAAGTEGQGHHQCR